MSKLLSIIVPVYNAERYIKKCISSLIEQTYTRIEIILVNDGSTDQSKAICEKLQLIDSRITLINKVNEGPSIARKIGIENANGDYITFVDADDYLNVNAYSIIMKEFDSDIDLIEFGYNEVTDFDGIKTTKELNKLTINNNEACLVHYLSQKNTTNFLWNRVYKRKLFNNIEYPKFYAGEDSCILCQIYLKCHRIKTMTGEYYNYVLSTNSLTRSEFNEKKLDNIEAGKFMYRLLNKKGIGVFAAYYICSYSSKLYCELKLTSSYNNKKKILIELSNVFNEYYPLIQVNSKKIEISQNRRLFIKLFKCSKVLSVLLYGLVQNGKIKKG